MEKSDLHLVVAGTKDGVNMVEAGAQEIAGRRRYLEAILFGHEIIKELVAFQEEIVRKCGHAKMESDLISRWMKTSMQSVRKLATSAIVGSSAGY